MEGQTKLKWHKDFANSPVLVHPNIYHCKVVPKDVNWSHFSHKWHGDSQCNFTEKRFSLLYTHIKKKVESNSKKLLLRNAMQFFFAKCLHLMKFNFHFLHMQLKEGDVEKFRIAWGTDTEYPYSTLIWKAILDPTFHWIGNTSFQFWFLKVCVKTSKIYEFQACLIQSA